MGPLCTGLNVSAEKFSMSVAVLVPQYFFVDINVVLDALTFLLLSDGLQFLMLPKTHTVPHYCA